MENFDNSDHVSSPASPADNDMAAAPDAGPQVPLIITAPITRTPFHELARRKPNSAVNEVDKRSAYCIQPDDIANIDDCILKNARNMVMVQDTWQQMLQNAKKKFTNTFWNYFLPFHSCSGVVIDTALASVKKVFLRNFLSTKECRAFPGSRRQMMSKLGCIDEFWSLLGHTHRIDLTSFNLPSGTRHIDFRFIDPVWAWIMSARNQCPHGMHFQCPRPVVRTS